MRQLAGSTGIPRATADFYRTPTHATEALLDREYFYGDIWEPACGDGAISDVLKHRGYSVYSSDLHDYGYGDVRNFFDEGGGIVPNIVTNPPYKYAQRFVEHALDLSQCKVAMLLKLNFLEGQRRKSFFQRHPPTRVYVFSKRLSFDRGNEKNKGRGLLAYAWFVWARRRSTDETVIRWI